MLYNDETQCKQRPTVQCCHSASVSRVKHAVFVDQGSHGLVKLQWSIRLKGVLLW